jgi:GT2 family glycosyltransferase
MNGRSDAITVVIPNFNGAALLPACLDSLLRQRRPPAAVVVVDNGSRDPSRDLALRHPLRPTLIAFPENRGFAAAVNAGIRAAETPAVALLNNDALADPRWIEAGARGMDRFPEADFFASLILRRQARDRVDSAGDAYPHDGRPRPLGRDDRAAGYDRVQEVFSASAGAAFFRRRLFDRVGWFDESFFAYLEDVDFGFRARLLGHRCLLLPEAVVFHQGAATPLADRPGTRSEESSRRVRWIARNKVFVLAQNLPGRWLVTWSPSVGFGLARSAGYHLLRSGQFASFLAGTLEGLARLPGRWSRRRSLQKQRQVRLADLAELMRLGARPWP